MPLHLSASLQVSGKAVEKIKYERKNAIQFLFL
jgi:hypothetical protein